MAKKELPQDCSQQATQEFHTENQGKFVDKPQYGKTERKLTFYVTSKWSK